MSLHARKKRKRVRICQISNCTKQSQSGGVCCRHATVIQNMVLSTKHPTATDKKKTYTQRKKRNCIYKDCFKRPRVKNLCKHYKELQNATNIKESDSICPANTMHTDISQNTRSSMCLRRKAANPKQYIQRNLFSSDEKNRFTTYSSAVEPTTQKYVNTNKYQCFIIEENQNEFQQDLEEEINYLLDESQVLIEEIPSINIESGRKNCIEQFKYWMEMILAKIKEKYKEYQLQLNQYHKHIETKKEQWKRSLIKRLETKVQCVLKAQLEKYKINRIEMNQALITVTNIEDNKIDVNIPHLYFPSINFNDFDWIDELSADTLSKDTNQWKQIHTAISTRNDGKYM
ncbi:hypothetical protein I4U23_023492 [Adineta vaga]|nr:hypothetical protein I4U23_023492 [Adineta vaga]